MADNVLLKQCEAEETTSSGIILATTVEWYGIGGYMQQFLDACWLYGDKEKISKILIVLLMTICLCACGGENKQEKFVLEGKWIGEKNHSIEFLDTENAIFNYTEAKDLKLKYEYNEELKTIELIFPTSINFEIKEYEGVYYLSLGTNGECYFKNTNLENSSKIHDIKITSKYKPMTFETTEILNNSDVQFTMHSLTVSTTNNLININTEMTVANMGNLHCEIFFDIANIQRTHSLCGFILTANEDNNIKKTYDLTSHKTMQLKNYLTGNTYIIVSVRCNDTLTKYYIDITNQLK